MRTMCPESSRITSVDTAQFTSLEYVAAFECFKVRNQTTLRVPTIRPEFADRKYHIGATHAARIRSGVKLPF